MGGSMDNGKDRKNVTMLKRVLAIVGIVLLLAMYGILFYEALTGSPETPQAFINAAAATVAIPIIIYIVMWLVKKFSGK